MRHGIVIQVLSRVAAILPLVVMVTPMAAMADATPIQVTYQGNAFDDTLCPNVPAGFPVGTPPETVLAHPCYSLTALSGVLTLDSLPADTSGATIDFSANVLSYSFTDGRTTITQESDRYAERFFFNIENGVIIGWFVDLLRTSPFVADESYRMRTSGGAQDPVVTGTNLTRDTSEYCATTGIDCFNNYFQQSLDAPGRFVTVPEPGTMLQQLLTDVTGVGPGKILEKTVAQAQTYYAVPDVQATCAVMRFFDYEVRVIWKLSNVTKRSAPWKITTEQMDDWLGQSGSIQIALGCD